VYMPAVMERHQAISEMEAASYPADEAASPAGIKFRLQHAGRYFLIAEREGELLGFVNGTLTTSATLTDKSMEKHEPDGSMLCIHSVCVSEKFRRQRIATNMLREYVERVREMPEIKSIALICKAQSILYLFLTPQTAHLCYL